MNWLLLIEERLALAPRVWLIKFMPLFLLCLLLINACVSTAPSSSMVHVKKRSIASSGDLVVLVDHELALYEQVITGIHVTGVKYQVLRVKNDDFAQAAFLERILSVRPKALIALGARSASAIASARIILPSVFSMVPSIDRFSSKDIFYAGIRMIPGSKKQVSLVRALVPDIKRLGVLFSRPNSREAMQKIRSQTDGEKFELVTVEIHGPGDVMKSLQSRHGEFDAFLMLDDPLLLNVDVIKRLGSFLLEKRIPFFALDCSMVKEGAFAGFGVNFFNLGNQLINTLKNKEKIELYQGTKILNPKKSDVCINLSVINQFSGKDKILRNAAEYAARTEQQLKIY